jgi:hypothetical protein
MKVEGMTVNEGAIAKGRLSLSTSTRGMGERRGSTGEVDVSLLSPDSSLSIRDDERNMLSRIAAIGWRR